MTTTPDPTQPESGLMLRRFAHELNSQLGVALMAASVQQEQIEALALALHGEAALQPLLDDLREASSLSSASLQLSARLVQQALGRSTPADQAPRALADVARQALAMQLRKHPALQVDAQLDLPAHWQGEALAWHQIFSNLIGNSLLHGFADRAGGVITLSGHEDAPGHCVIDYRDDGTGLPAALAGARLFEEGVTSQQGNGHGLGLGIVRQLLTQRLHGSIEHMATPQGIHFRLRFAPTSVLVPTHHP